jgi:hypothetical protein
MDRMDERKAIAAELDNIEAGRKSVNEQPEVIEARRQCRLAKEAADAADRRFQAAFNKYYPREEKVVERMSEEHLGLFTLGDDEYPWIVRCAVSGLPIFEGDKVFIGGGEEDYRKSYILADAVQLSPAFAHLTPQIAKREDIEEDPDDIDCEDDSEEDEAA